MNPYSVSEIAYLQNQLNIVPADGIVGPVTEKALRAYTNSRRKDQQLITLAYQKLINSVSKRKPIAEDGILGPVTEYQISLLVKTPYVTAPSNELCKEPTRPAWTKDLPAHNTDWLNEYYGKPGTNLIRYRFPMPMYYDGKLVKTTMVNKKIVDSLDMMFAGIMEAYTQEQITELGINVYGGCYNNRPVRGGTRRSTHAYAIALDIDPIHNRMSQSFAEARFSALVYQPYWNAVYKAGFVGLGFRSNMDVMHVQLTR